MRVCTPLYRDVGMGCKTLTGLGINLKNYRDFGSEGHNFYWDAGLCCMLLLGYGMGLIFYLDDGMVPPVQTLLESV